MTSPQTERVPDRRLPIGNDILCELAHELTVRECALRQIPLDIEGEDETNYTDDAQTVFDVIYDIVARVLGSDAEVQP